MGAEGRGFPTDVVGRWYHVPAIGKDAGFEVFGERKVGVDAAEGAEGEVLWRPVALCVATDGAEPEGVWGVARETLNLLVGRGDGAEEGGIAGEDVVDLEGCLATGFPLEGDGVVVEGVDGEGTGTEAGGVVRTRKLSI